MTFFLFYFCSRLNLIESGFCLVGTLADTHSNRGFIWFTYMHPFRTIRFFPQHEMLRVSLTPWRKRFAVIAGFPLSGPPRGNAPLLLWVFLVGPLWLDPSPFPFKGEISLPNTILTTQRYLRVFGWTPRLCLLKAKFRSLTRY